MADLNHSTGRKNTSTIKAANHRSTRVDLTPMVDLGFLLITFFVFTTTMAQPAVLDLYEPIEGNERPVAESGAMTIILSGQHQMYFYQGQLSNSAASNKMQKTDLKNIRRFILEKKRNTDINKLMFIIKAHNNSTYGDNVNLVDEMFICQIPAGHFAESELNEVEMQALATK